jgi:hypothetical protein
MRIGRIFSVLMIAPLAALAAQDGDVRVTFHEPTTDIAAAVALPVEPIQRIQYQYVGTMAFGLTIDQQKWLCCGPGAIRTTFKVDNTIVFPNVVGVKPQPLPPDAFGRVRPGLQTSLAVGNVHITQVLEVIPSKPAPGQLKRPLDNMLIRYVIENKDAKPHAVGTRVRIDTMCNNNDGALFAAPTRPGEILNGVELVGTTLPDYVQILEVPNLKAPGFTGHFTLKMTGNRIGPDRFQATSHQAGDNGWDSMAIASNGDSDCVLFWSPRVLAPGQKMEMAYAYGQGIASLPDAEGQLRVSLGGNFAPGRLFTVRAFVEEPLLGQTLSLELPAGMTLVEGSATQPAAPPDHSQGAAVVLWRGRVDGLGDFVLRIRSSNGVTQTRKVSVTRSG